MWRWWGADHSSELGRMAPTEADPLARQQAVDPSVARSPSFRQRIVARQKWLAAPNLFQMSSYWFRFKFVQNVPIPVKNQLTVLPWQPAAFGRPIRNKAVGFMLIGCCWRVWPHYNRPEGPNWYFTKAAARGPTLNRKRRKVCRSQKLLNNRLSIRAIDRPLIGSLNRINISAACQPATSAEGKVHTPGGSSSGPAHPALLTHAPRSSKCKMFLFLQSSLSNI